MSYKRPRPCLNSMFYFTICLFYTIKQQQQKDFFFLCFSYLQIGSSGAALEGGRAAGGKQQQERQQKQRVAGVGVSVDVLPLRHTFFRGLHHHSSQTIYCGEVRCEAPIKLASPLRNK